MREKVADATLAQKSTATGEERSFEIYNKKFLRIHSRNMRNEIRYDINLAMMEPWPIRHRKISWRWLSLVIVMLALSTALGIYMSLNADNLNYGFWIPLLAGAIFFTLGAIILFIIKSPNVMEFRSRYGGCVLISMFYRKPNNRDFNEFVEQLKNRILGATQQLTIDKSQMLAIELKELRRLTSEGAISDADYARAKDRIFRLHSASG